MRILFAAAPGYGLMLPIVPLMWAARAAGHEVLVATAAEMVEVGANAGLQTYDTVPDRDVWRELIDSVASDMAGTEQAEQDDEPDSPFGLFTLTMTERTIAAGRAFGADLVVSTSDHAAGALAAVALDVPALEVGNRISWSMRDPEFRAGRFAADDDQASRTTRTELGIPDGRPRLVARVDPRVPSMGGLVADETDPRDGVAWWPMRFVPYNGGAMVPDWALARPDRPRVCVTLGTVVPTLSGVGTVSIVLEALAGMDVDVVLAGGKADLASIGDLPATVRSVGYLALSSFLPTCSLIVHHGGSGTTASPLHYGVPQLVLPSFADNHMSAERVATRGVGLACQPAEATVPTVRELVDRLLNEPAFRTAAGEVSAEMATQPSPATVIERAVRALD
ncbi:MAG: DUF1205 domain-containing protein [Kutzneria sp.]|nr:DUF1205 domain-containing protein [Kutzneria sp.]